VHALRRIHESLAPGGILLDMHPIPPHTRVEVRGESLGDLEDEDFLETVAATEAPLWESDLFSLEEELEFDWLERFDSAEELLEEVDGWEELQMPADVAARVRNAEPPIDIWERVVLRRFSRNPG
jgi:hypothetical protein